MDRTSIIGIILGIIAVGVGMLLKGISFEALVNPAAFLIIIFGTVAAVLIAFPTRVIKNIPSLFKILFLDQQTYDEKQLILTFIHWAEVTRREGLLSLEKELDQIKEPFLQSGIQMATDGQSPDFMEDVLIGKITAMEKRHEEGAAVFTQAGTYAPTLGVLGAVVGLIAALGSMDNMDVLGAAISAAFIATLFGIFTGYVLWHPFANKLREKSKREVLIKEIMIEGILSITAGESPAVMKDKLSSFLSTKELIALDQYMESQVNKGEAEAEG